MVGGVHKNLEDTEVPAPASTSHDSDSERPANVVSRKHSIFLTFLETDVCLRTKM